MVYDGITKKFFANTRKGATLEFDDSKRALLWIEKNHSELLKDYNTDKKEDLLTFLEKEYEKYRNLGTS